MLLPLTGWRPAFQERRSRAARLCWECLIGFVLPAVLGRAQHTKGTGPAGRGGFVRTLSRRLWRVMGKPANTPPRRQFGGYRAKLNKRPLWSCAQSSIRDCDGRRAAIERERTAKVRLLRSSNAAYPTKLTPQPKQLPHRRRHHPLPMGQIQHIHHPRMLAHRKTQRPPCPPAARPGKPEFSSVSTLKPCQYGLVTLPSI